MTTLENPAAPTTERKPLDREIDVYGLTHTGKVRRENQDHFLVCALRKHIDVVGTSLPNTADWLAPVERFAFLAMVADGVGGGQRGEEASRRTVQAVTEYVVESVRCYYASGADLDNEFESALEDAALRCHAAILERGDADPAAQGMATTLTLYLGMWPRVYILQVGDSRYYLLRDDTLTQVSADQTMAEELVRQGVMTRTDARNTPWSHVLSSAIGGPQTAPVVTRLDHRWGDVHLLCSDGLTRHVTDERIHERLRTMTSARQACEALLADALEGGGADNITIIVGRAVPGGVR